MKLTATSIALAACWGRLNNHPGPVVLEDRDRLPVRFTSAVTREKLFFASASLVVRADILPLSILATITARIWHQINRLATTSAEDLTLATLA